MKDYLVLDAHVCLLLLEEVGEFGVEVLGNGDVGEHAVELVGELVAARLLQPVDHGLLQVHGVGLLVDQTLAYKRKGMQ